MSNKDYYKILGVEKNATKEDIKSSYKKLAKKYHPDLNKNSDASEKFKEINEAASVLGDDKKREHYDRFGTADAGGNFGGFDFSDFMRSNQGGFPFEDVFEDIFGEGFFGGQGRRTRVIKGRNIRYDLEITLKEAFEGTKKQVLLKKSVPCKHCDGTGAEDKKLSTCDSCNGSGIVKRASKTLFGVFVTQTTCNKCDGEGKIAKNLCEYCDGSGLLEESKKIDIKIPAGISTGDQLVVEGEGEALRSAKSGDLYLVVHVEKDDKIKRSGQDILINVDIDFITAILGGTIEIISFDKKIDLDIPQGLASETTFKLKEKGFPSFGGRPKGDLFVKTRIVVPNKVNKKQKELLEDFKKQSENWLSKLINKIE